MAKYRAVLLCERGDILPLGLGCLKAYVDADKSLSSKVSVSIAYADDISSPAAAMKGRPALAGFSCCGDVSKVLKACAALKAADKRLRIVLGGPATSVIKPEELFSGGNVDFVVRGEGELTFKELLAALAAGKRDLAGIPGLAFMQGGRLEVNPPRPEMRGLDALPSPYLAGVFDLTGRTKFFVEGSRGCGFSCRYCAEGVSALRYFGAGRLVSEVRYILEHAPQAATVSPTDADFFLDRRRAAALLKAFLKLSRGRRASFVLTSNPHSWDDAVMSALSSERFPVSIGIQSINPRALACANRRADVGELKRKMRRFKLLAPEARFSVDLIDGLPGDDLEGYQKTLDWAISTGGDLELNHLMVLPDTHFGMHETRYGIVSKKKYPYSVVSNSTFTAADIRRAEALKRRIGPILGRLSLDRYITAAVLRLGAALRGRVPYPYVAVCDEFAAFARNRPEFRPLSEEWSRTGHGGYTAQSNLRTRALALARMRAFGAGLLKKYGCSGRYTEFSRAVAASLGRLLFRERSAERGRVAGQFSWTRKKPGTLLVCRPDSGDPHHLPWDKLLLIKDFFTDETYANRENPAFGEPVSSGMAVPSLRRLPRGTGFGLIVLSGVLADIPAADRRGIFRELRRLARPDAGLLIFQDPRVSSRAPGGAPARLTSELASAGWGRPPASFPPAARELNAENASFFTAVKGDLC